MPTVNRFGSISEVKNLRWLVDKARTVGVRSVAVRDLLNTPRECRMTAYLENGWIFETAWASRTVCRQWLSRRKNLRGVPLDWNGVTSTCDHTP